jgi:hypothetical protein
MATRNEPDRISHELTRDLAAFQLRTGSGGSKWDSLAESGSRDSDPEYSASEVDLTPGASSVRTTSISAVSQDDKDARGQPSLYVKYSSRVGTEPTLTVHAGDLVLLLNGKKLLVPRFRNARKWFPRRITRRSRGSIL